MATNDPGRAAFQADAFETVKKLYAEHLDQEINDSKIASNDKSYRLQRYENGAPVNFDEKALQSAESKHMEVAAAGGTDLQAEAAARKSFQEEKDRQQTVSRGGSVGAMAVSVATMELIDHLQKQDHAPADDRSATKELLDHLQGTKHEVTGPALDPHLQQQPKPPGRSL